jgi:hypothetical protein
LFGLDFFDVALKNTFEWERPNKIGAAAEGVFIDDF